MSFSENVPRFLGYRPGNPPFLAFLGAQVNKTVQMLNLGRNNIGDEGTIALAAALKVSFVLFRECSAFSWLPPPGNPPFTRLDAQVNKTVQVLDLSENEVGDKGTIALAKALKVSFCRVPRMFLVFLVTAPVTNLF